jgi:hypothetical protein
MSFNYTFVHNPTGKKVYDCNSENGFSYIADIFQDEKHGGMILEHTSGVIGIAVLPDCFIEAKLLRQVLDYIEEYKKKEEN